MTNNEVLERLKAMSDHERDGFCARHRLRRTTVEHPLDASPQTWRKLAKALEHDDAQREQEGEK